MRIPSGKNSGGVAGQALFGGARCSTRCVSQRIKRPVGVETDKPREALKTWWRSTAGERRKATTRTSSGLSKGSSTPTHVRRNAGTASSMHGRSRHHARRELPDGRSRQATSNVANTCEQMLESKPVSKNGIGNYPASGDRHVVDERGQRYPRGREKETYVLTISSGEERTGPEVGRFCRQIQQLRPPSIGNTAIVPPRSKETWKQNRSSSRMSWPMRRP